MVNYGLIELALVFGVVLAVALWELYEVRKSLDPRREDKKDDDDGQPHP